MSDLLPFKEYISEIKVLGSRFIAILEPLMNENEIDEYLTKFREVYPKATHYCYAARLDALERMSDDGEPSRSAGMPLLTILRQHGITRALVLVIRYFGGTKLGLPRLTRTYRDSAEDVISKASFARIIEGIEMPLEMSYADYEYVKKLVAKTNLTLFGEQYGENVSISIKGEKEELNRFVESLSYEIIRGEQKTIQLLKKEEK
ncbi:MAG: YigZ family protein [Bacilli bacterium]|nr:YigZ family protein [Bacilli bacterium]